MKTIKLTTESGEELEISEESLKLVRSMDAWENHKKDSRFVPEEEGEYWYLDERNHRPYFSNWYNNDSDNYRLNTNNVFKTEEEAEKEQKRRQALADVTQYCYENDLVLVDIDWEADSQYQYEAVYNHGKKRFEVISAAYRQALNQLPYLKSEEACEQAIKNCEADLKIIFNVK